MWRCSINITRQISSTMPPVGQYKSVAIIIGHPEPVSIIEWLRRKGIFLVENRNDVDLGRRAVVPCEAISNAEFHRKCSTSSIRDGNSSVWCPVGGIHNVDVVYSY